MVVQVRYSQMHDAMCGAVDLGDGLTPIDIWQGLHAGARSWGRTSYGVAGDQDRVLIDASDLSVLRVLQNFPATNWTALCEAVGWTVYGAVALSWCKGADLRNVWSAWLASGFLLKPLAENERPARLLNPQPLPQTASLSEIVLWANAQGYPDAETYSLAFSAMIARLTEPLVFDMAMERLHNPKAQVAAVLKARMLQKPNRSTEENSLLVAWDRVLAGTDFDIWKGVATQDTA